MTASATYHWRICTSQRESACYLRLDKTGILITIVVSLAVGVVLGYTCNPVLQKVYLFQTISIALMMVVSITMPKVEKYSVEILILCALSGFVPAFHWCFVANGVAFLALGPALVGMI